MEKRLSLIVLGVTEVAHNPSWTIADDGSVSLASK